MATRDPAGIGLDGWSPAPKVAPPWLWLLAAPAARVNANMEALLPTVPAQVLRLAVPTSSGSQGPFVAAASPASPSRRRAIRVPPQSDTLANVSTETLTKVGSTRAGDDHGDRRHHEPGARSGGTIFLTRSRTLPGGSLALILAAFLLPLAGVTVDLFAHCRRARVTLRPAVVRAALHLTPWLVLLAIVYLANLLGQLPRSPGAVIPPGSRVVDNPRYLRVVILVALLVLAYGYAVAVARRLERRVATDPRATIFVAHAFLVLVAALALLDQPLRRAAGAARRRPLAAGEARRLGAFDPAGLLGADHDPGRARLLRAAAGDRMEGLVVLLPAAREPHRSRGGGAAGRAVPLHRRHRWPTPCTSAAWPRAR